MPYAVNPVIAIVAVLATASMVICLYLLLGGCGQAPIARVRAVFVPFVPLGLLMSTASPMALEALTRAPAMVVAALIATQTLWVVALSSVPIWATQ